MDRKRRLETDERTRLRALVDDAKRAEVEADRRSTEALRSRSPEEVKRQTAARKAILATVEAPDVAAEAAVVVAESTGSLYLVSLGEGSGCTVHMGAGAAVVSPPTAMHDLLGSDVDWQPFAGARRLARAIAASVAALHAA